MTATFKTSDPATDHLLDFIAGGVPTNPSGESAGNYNAVFGHINASDPLSAKTLTEIYAMQDRMLASNRISTATGRYQGLKSTIKEYQTRKGLPDSALFTEALQDDFGLRKMLDRGYDDWCEGLIDDNEFMYRLSCEWASLPDPYNGGRSHYDGDAAGNHASTTLAHFQAALAEARAFLKPRRPVMAAEKGVRWIQEILVLTGDLPASEVDGIPGPQTQAALDSLFARA